MNRRLLPLFFLFSLLSPALRAENAFTACVTALSVNGAPSVEIHVQGELHSRSAVHAALVAETAADRVFLLLEGAAYGANVKATGLGTGEVTAEGPIFGIEHPLAHLLQELHFQYFHVVGHAHVVPAVYYAEADNRARWLRFAALAAKSPRYFQAVQKDPAASGVRTLETLAELVALGDPHRALDAIEREGKLPASLEDHAAALRVFLEVGMTGLEKQLPFLAPYFASPRASLRGGHREHDLSSVADLVMIRDYFIGQSIAKIVARHAGRGKKFVVLVGNHHVADLVRLLEAELRHLSNVRITSATDRTGADPAKADRDREILLEIARRAPPRP